MRFTAVAGSFYASDEEQLKHQIEECFLHSLGPGKIPEYKMGERKIKGAVVPHAGYMYSGPVACNVYSALAEDGFPETFVIIGPNHTGQGSGVALTMDTFVMPFGNVDIDCGLAKKMLNTIIDSDINAHRYEHSIEVQIPFLQYVNKNFKIVPVCLGIQDYKTACEVGEIIRKAIGDKDVVVLASTDFTHYESKESASKKDRMAIDAILSLDTKRLYETVMKNRITMCGYGAVIAMLEATKPKNAKLLKYATSGDIAPMREVVGYAGIIVE